MKITVKAYFKLRIARYRAHRIADSFSASECFFLTGGVRTSRQQVTSSENRKFGPPWPGGRAVAKLSLSAQLCWAEGRLAVGYPYLIISLVQKLEEKDFNEPLVYCQIEQ